MAAGAPIRRYHTDPACSSGWGHATGCDCGWWYWVPVYPSATSSAVRYASVSTAPRRVESSTVSRPPFDRELAAALVVHRDLKPENVMHRPPRVRAPHRRGQGPR